MDDFIKFVLPAILAGLIAIVITLVKAWLDLKGLKVQFKEKFKELEKQIKYQELREKEKEKAMIQLKYLNPLRLAASDFHEHIISIKETLKGNDAEKKQHLRSSFQHIRNADRNDRQDFARWCNFEGHYAVATLYSTIVYLSHASRIRSELPFIELQRGDDQTLLKHLSGVRKSLGGEFGIWEVLQDSLGSYIRKDGVIANYREFCTDLIDNDTYVWFLRLIEFYKDIHMKQEKELDAILISLDELLRFLTIKPNQSDITSEIV